MAVGRGATGGSTDGTEIEAYRYGVDKDKGGGDARGIAEWILKPDTVYVVTIETFEAIYVTFMADWYEHTDKH
jgi:hypothetical protein